VNNDNGNSVELQEGINLNVVEANRKSHKDEGR
jgi:hypothetical protein